MMQWRKTGKKRMEIKNIELKAKYADLEEAARISEALGARFDCEERQEDSFYNVPDGRLKLRRSSSLGAQLIFYRRADTSEKKESTGTRTPVPDPAEMHAILSTVLGVRCTVRKRRRVYWLDNAKINIDEVEGLGKFIEFEVVLDAAHGEAEGQLLMDSLIREFDIEPEQRISVAYADMLMNTGG